MENEVLLNNYNTVLDLIKSIKAEYGIKSEVKIIAVTKYSSIETLRNFISLDLGLPCAESKAQSLKERAQLIKNALWHFIGRIQINKIKYIVPHACLIQSVDSKEILDEIENHALKNNKIQDALIQVNISGEEQKGGVKPECVGQIFDHVSALKNVNVIGVMGIASYSENENQIEKEFESLRNIFESLRKEYKNLNIKEVSMGMSGDYKLAVKHGSTMVRIGSSLFG